MAVKKQKKPEMGDEKKAIAPAKPIRRPSSMIELQALRLLNGI